MSSFRRAGGSRWTVLVLALALGVVAATRIPSLDVLVWNLDEEVTAAMADVVRAGGVPYRDGVDHRGPATYYAYAAVFALAGGRGEHRLWAVHVALIALVALVVTATYAVGACAFDRRTGALAGLLLACLSAAPAPWETLAFHTEWTLLLFSVPAVGCCVLAVRSDRETWLLAAGGLFGFAFLAKQPAGLELAAAGAFLAFRNWRLDPRARGWARGAREVGCLALGFTAVVGAVVGAFALAGAWSDFVLWFWRYNTEIYLPAVPLAERFAGGLTYWDDLLHVYRALGCLLALGLLGLGFSWLRWKEGEGPAGHAAEPNLEVLLLLWLGAAYLGASLSGRSFGHYSLPLLPAASLLGARGLLLLFDALRRTLGARPAPARSLRDAAIAVLLLGALSERLPARPEAGWQRFAALDAERNAAVAELVEQVSANSRPEDRIFVWGWFSSLYTLTDRLPASRFLYCTFLAGLIPWTNLEDADTLDRAVPGSWAMFRADLRRHRPVYIVDATPGNYGYFRKYPATTIPELARLLEREYVRERVMRLSDGSDYFYLYRRRDGHPD